MQDDLVGILDIGSSKVAGALFDFESGADNVVAFATVPCKGLKKGMIADLDLTASAVEEVIKSLEKEIGSDAPPFVISVSGAQMEGICVQGYIPIYPKTRPISSDDVLQVVNHSRQVMLPPDREQVQAIPREFRIDGQRGIKHPIGLNGSRLEVVTFLVTGLTSQLQSIERSVTLSGAKVSQMVLGPLASALGTLSLDEREIGTVCVDIGAGKTDLAIFYNGAIAYSACIPIGGATVTSDISNLLRTSPEEAERLKRAHGRALASSVEDDRSVDVLQVGQSEARPLQRRVLCEIVESRMRELTTFVNQHIEFSGLSSNIGGGIVLTGGGSQLSLCGELFANQIKNYRVRVSAPEIKFSTDKKNNFTKEPNLAALAGLIEFAGHLGEDEFAPTSGIEHWKSRVRTLWSVIAGKT